jgi:hypothetical protein
VGSADVVFLVLGLVIVQGGRQTMLDDPGLGWHLRNIDAMRAAGGWLTVDPFSQPRAGQPPDGAPWYSNQWLGELPLWLGERWAGLEGIAVVCALFLALLLSCLYRMLLRDGLPWPLAAFWTALAALGTACSWVARPNLFTLFFMLLTARVCEQFHLGRCSRKAALWLLPLFAVWANVHGGFVAGFTLLGAALAVEVALALLALDGGERRAARGRAFHLALLVGGTFAATLCNPYGFSLYPWLFQLLGDPYFMGLHHEWKSPDFHQTGSFRYELLLLVFPLLLAASKRRPTLVELALTIPWLHFALTGFRYVPVWVVLAVPVMARASAEVPWLQALAGRWGQAGEGKGLFAPWMGRLPWAWSAAIALAFLGWARWQEGRFARHKHDFIPVTALDRLLELHRERPQAVVFHGYDWGGYLTWHGWPGFRNWIDDRNEVQGKEHIEEYFSIVRADPGWEQKLDRAGVAFVCLHPGAPLALCLGEREGEGQRLAAVTGAGSLAVGDDWREVYRDRFAVIFERRQARSP